MDPERRNHSERVETKRFVRETGSCRFSFYFLQSTSPSLAGNGDRGVVSLLPSVVQSLAGVHHYLTAGLAVRVVRVGVLDSHEQWRGTV